MFLEENEGNSEKLGHGREGEHGLQQQHLLGAVSG